MSFPIGPAHSVSRGAGALIAAAACLLLALPGGAGAQEPPRRILSLNLCADQLLLALLPPERIVSLTWLSRSEGDPDLVPLARRIAANHGTAEEVLAAQPDLVIAGTYTTSATRRLLARTATPLLELPAVQDWAGIRRVTRQVARAVGAEARGAALLSQMDATLAALARTRPADPVRVISWGGGGSDVPGRDTLFDQILTAAGGENLGAPLAGRASVDLEQLLQARPEVLMRGSAYAAMPAVRNQAAAHRLIQRLYPQAQLTYPEALYGCGVPKAAQAALALRAQLLAARAARGPR